MRQLEIGEARMFSYLKRLSIAGLAMACFACDGRAQNLLAPGECEMLKKVVANTANDFLLLKGANIGDDKWRASLLLPGSRACYIDRYKRVSYMCESQIVASQPNALDARNRRLEAIQE